MVKVYYSTWCPWCKEVTESIIFNLLKGNKVEIIDPFSIDTRLGIFNRPDILTEPTIIDSKNRIYYKSFLTKEHFMRVIRYSNLNTKKLVERLSSRL